MRWLRILAWTFGGLVAALSLSLAAMQTGPGKRWLAATLSSVASTPDRQVALHGLSGFVPTDLMVAELTLADRQGTWLKAEEVRLNWSLVSLLAGRLRIDMLAARRIEVERPPLPDDKPAAPSSGDGGLPVGIDLRLLSISELHLAEPVMGVNSRWKLDAVASLASDGRSNHLHLTLNRTDGPAAHLSADLRFELAHFAIDGRLSLDEAGPGGVTAVLLGRPDLERTSLRLVAKGDADTGTATLRASADDAVTATGDVRWQPNGASTGIDFRLRLTTANLPDTPLARLLSRPVSLDGEAAVDRAGIWTLRRSLLEVGSARMTASGRYDTSADKLEAAADLEAPEAGAFVDLLGGMGWRDLRATLQTDLRGLARKPFGNATMTASALDVTNTPAGKVDVTAKLDLRRDGRLVVEEASLAGAGTTLRASGDYLPATGVGEMQATIDVGSLQPFSPLAGAELAGRGGLELRARTERDRARVTWRGTFEGLGLPDVPARLLQPSLRLGGTAELADGAWSFTDVRLATETVSLQADGRGRDRSGALKLVVSVPRLDALQPEVPGQLEAVSTLTVEGEAVRGEMRARGTVADQPLAFDGRFLRDEDGGFSVPVAQGSWASATMDVRDFAVTPRGMTGSGRLHMARLEELSPLIGTTVAGALDLAIATEQDAGTVKLELRGDNLRSGGSAVGELRFEAVVRDPLGVAETDARIEANRLAGIDELARLEATVKGNREAFDLALRAAGGRTNANVAARIEHAAEEIRVAVARLEGRYQAIPLKLTHPARVRVVGERVTLEPASFQVGAGRIRAGGVVDPGASDLELDIAALPLNILSALTPGASIEGTLQARLRLRGPSASPRIEATYNAAGLRLRRPGMALVPPLALRGSASLVGRQATFDSRIGGGGATNLALKGRANLAPFAANVDVGGVLDIGPFAPLLGNDVRNLAGTVRPDLTVEIAGARIAGRGTAALAGLALALPDSGVRLSDGEGVLALEGDTLRLQRLAFQTANRGRVNGTGTVRLDPAQGFPLDLGITTQRAVAVSRPDLVATVTSDVRVTGSSTTAIDVAGRIHVDRAEIVVGAEQAAGYPTVEVREINAPKGQAMNGPMAPPRKAPPKPAAPTSVRLALTIDAPSAIFVRGRGLDAEMGGQLQVGGDPARPGVLGSLALRRGSFNLAGRRLSFSRGNVSLVNANTIDPRLDFVASTSVHSTTINLTIAGTARAPKFAVSSSPSLPQDEAMAMLLFGKPSTGLSPFEILSAAQALAELSGAAPAGGGFLARLRRSLGLDQLSVDTPSGSGKAADSVSVGAGSYVAPGVYVGAKQGGAAGSSRGVVEIEVLRNTKIEADVGADTNSRIGVKLEWDY